MDPGRSRHRDERRATRAQTARELGGPHRNVRGAGQRERRELQRSRAFGGLPVRPGDRQHRHRERHRQHPVRPADHHRQHRLARRAAVRVRGARPGGRRHAAAVRARQPRLHRAGERPDPADLVGVHGQHRRHRLRRVCQRPAPRQRRRGRADLYRQSAGQRERRVLRARSRRGGQPVGEQQHRHPQRHPERHESGAAQADHGVVDPADLRRGQRERRLGDPRTGKAAGRIRTC